MKKLLPFLMALAMLPAVAFGASGDSNNADAAVADVPEDAGTVEGPPESVEDEEDGHGHTQGQSSMSGSDGTDISTEPDAVPEEEAGTQEGEAREVPFDEDEGSAGQDVTNGFGQDDTDEMEEDDAGTQEGQPESVEEDVIN